MRTPRGVAEAHALARILGSLYTDGTARFDETDKVFSGRLYLGHAIDAEQAANDIELVSGSRPTISPPTDQADYFKVHFRGAFVRALHENPHIRIPLGRRVSQAYELPKVVTDENAPISFVREFLRGLFGGDGGMPVPKKRGATTWSTVTFHMSKVTLRERSLQLLMLSSRKSRLRMQSRVSMPSSKSCSPVLAYATCRPSSGVVPTRSGNPSFPSQ